MDMPLQFNMEKMGRSMAMGGNGTGMDDMGHQGHDVSTSSDIIGAGDRMMQPQMMGMMGGPMGGNAMGGPMGGNPMGGNPMGGNHMGGSVGMNPMGGGAMGTMGFSGTMNMMGPDPNMMMMGPMGYNQFTGFNMGQMGAAMDCPPEFMRKDVIELKFGTLFPPPPGAPPRSRRDKPHGCRTAFVGSLPDGVSEQNIFEIFERFGNIESVRLNKNNYCHIRYQHPDSVEISLVLSGYTLKMEEEGDGVRSKNIHVDYAQARDDQYEFECLQRALARENRHRQQVEEDLMRPPSPPPVMRFSEYEAQILLEKLKNDDTFDAASSTLLSWLAKGDCNRRTANVFYSLVQSTNSHVRRLLSEKESHEKELENVKATFRHQIQGILNQFEHIENVFIEAQKQRTSDHFSKAQRKNIEQWCKQIQEIKRTEQEKFLSDRHEDEMEMSDSDDEDGPSPLKRKKGDQVSQNEVYQLREDNDSLKCQLEAYKNEVDILKQDSKKEVKILQQALQGMQQQLISYRIQSQKAKAKEAIKAKASKTKEEGEPEKGSDKKPEKGSDKGPEKGSDMEPENGSDKEPADKDTLEEESSDQEKDCESAEKATEEDEETEAEVASIDEKDKCTVDIDLTLPDPVVQDPIIIFDDPIISDPVVSAAVRFASEKRKQLEKEQKEKPLSVFPTTFPSTFPRSFVTPTSSTTVVLTEKEAKIVCLVSCFLHVHPFGASTDYLWSYLQRLNLYCRPSEIEELMERLPMVYKIELFGVGASLERRWKFIGFDNYQM